MRYVHNNGTIGRESPQRSYIGVRPAFYLDTDYYVATSGSGTKASPYIGSAPNKVEDDYTIAEPDDDPNQEWDISTDKKLTLTLGPNYSKDGKYSNPTIPIYTIQKNKKRHRKYGNCYLWRRIHQRSTTKIYKRCKKGVERCNCIRTLSQFC